MVIIYQETGCVDNINGFRMDTNKLIHFIDTYGVDYIDEHGRNLVYYIDRMTIEQIDIVMDKKPNMDLFDKEVFMKLTLLIKDKNMHILERLIDNDDKFKLVNIQLASPHPLYDMFFPKSRKGRMIEIMKHMCDKIGGSDIFIEKVILKINKAIILLENHEKRYYTFFDLMKQHLQLN